MNEIENVFKSSCQGKISLRWQASNKKLLFSKHNQSMYIGVELSIPIFTISLTGFQI